MDRIQLRYMTVHKKSNTVSGVKTLINIPFTVIIATFMFVFQIFFS